MKDSIYDVQMPLNNGEMKAFSDYAGKILLIVNTASRCGFTPQLEGLQQLHDGYANKGFSVLGFPCNQFGMQEPGTDKDIQTFCTLNFGVSFPLFQKSEVNGPNTSELYQFLKLRASDEEGRDDIQWNFTKFLVNAKGEVIKRYSSKDTPESIAADIEQLLVG
jgi:glutathione peroxidase